MAIIELQNFVERLIVVTDAERIDEADVERELARAPRSRRGAPGIEAREAAPLSRDASLAATRSDAERRAVLDALERAGGNRAKAARLLGISRRTLYNRLGEIEDAPRR